MARNARQIKLLELIVENEIEITECRNMSVNFEAMLLSFLSLVYRCFLPSVLIFTSPSSIMSRETVA